MAKENGDLVLVAEGFYMHVQQMDEIKSCLVEALQKSSAGMTMSELRQELNTSRKYAIPILEYLDENGFTLRDGDLRRLAE